jgi:RNA polymerase sigma-70 factor (ECF subfamily)
MFARTGSLPEAQDVASQAFAQILEMHDPQTVSFLKAYVYQVARHLWIDRCKLGAIHQRIDPVACYEWETTSPSPEPLLVDGQRAQVLRKAIEGLKPRLQMVLILRIWDELTYREIASRLAKEGVVVDERTVSNWFKDALEELGMTVEGMAEDLKGEGAE